MTNLKGKPVGGIWVEVGYKDGPRSGTSTEVRTNAAGRYRVGPVCTGESNAVAATEAPWYLEAERRITVKQGENTINFRLKPAAQIRYRVINGSWGRTPDYTVFDAKTGREYLDAWRLKLKADGDYLKVAPGKYRIKLRPRYEQNAKVLSKRTWSIAAKAGKRSYVTAKINKGGVIRGTLTPKNLVKSKCFGYGVVSVESNRGYTSFVRPARSGSFVIRDLPPGRYKIHMVAEYKGSERSDYYRAGTKKVATVTVKSGKTTKLKASKLAKGHRGEILVNWEDAYTCWSDD